MKLLLYCAKDENKLLAKVWKKMYEIFTKKEIVEQDALNGKIVAECDFEVEEIIYRETEKNSYSFGTETLTPNELLDKSCMTTLELSKYIGSNPNWIKGDYGKAVHIKNLHIFDTPKELNYFYDKDYNLLTKAPQNMCYTYDMEPQDIVLFGKIIENGTYAITQEYVLISIRPEWLCKILNGEKTIEIRKKVLKRMVK